MVDGENQFQGINLNVSKRSNILGSIIIDENSNNRIRFPNNNDNNQRDVNKEQDNNKDIINPFSFK